MPERVLLVYDNPGVTRSVQGYLRRVFPDVEVEVAETVNTALARLRGRSVSVVLTGVNFEIDGRQLLSEIRKHPRVGNTPIIALSTDAGTWQKERDLLELGFDTVLELPFALDGLIAAIEPHVPEAAAARQKRDRALDEKSRPDSETQVRPDPLQADIGRVLSVLGRFHTAAILLRDRHDSRATLEVVDEFDVQDLLRVLLSLSFNDVRREEWTPKYAGGSSRVDFLLKPQRIVIEVKKTRSGLGERQVGEELLIDRARYAKMADCDALVCFVYDPENRILNAAALEGDLSGVHDGVRVEVLVAPRETPADAV